MWKRNKEPRKSSRKRRKRIEKYVLRKDEQKEFRQRLIKWFFDEILSCLEKKLYNEVVKDDEKSSKCVSEE